MWRLYGQKHRHNEATYTCRSGPQALSRIMSVFRTLLDATSVCVCLCFLMMLLERMSHPMRGCQGAALRPQDALAFHRSSASESGKGATVLGKGKLLSCEYRWERDDDSSLHPSSVQFISPPTMRTQAIAISLLFTLSWTADVSLKLSKRLSSRHLSNTPLAI